MDNSQIDHCFIYINIKEKKSTYNSWSNAQLSHQMYVVKKKKKHFFPKNTDILKSKMESGVLPQGTCATQSHLHLNMKAKFSRLIIKMFNCSN